MPASIAPTLDADLAHRLADVALRDLGTEYPYHLVHMGRDASDMRAPRELFPVSWGSDDWRACVRMHWKVARCLRVDVTALDAEGIGAQFDSPLTSSGVARPVALTEPVAAATSPS